MQSSPVPPRPPTGAARRVDSGVRRRQILDAATVEFADKGYDGGSMREIARALGLKIAYVQYHFRDKRSLWDAVVSDVLGEYRREFDELLARNQGRPADELLRLIVDSLVRFAATHPHFVALMARTRRPAASEAQPYHREFDDGLAIFINLIEQAQANGRFVPGHPVILFAQLVGAALRFFTVVDLETHLGRSFLDPEVLDEHIRTCLGLFMRDGPAPSE